MRCTLTVFEKVVFAFALFIRLDLMNDSGMAEAGLNLGTSETNNLLAFALAGAGFKNFQSTVSEWSEVRIVQLATLFDKWKGNRSLAGFYRYVFVDNGYRCEEVGGTFPFLTRYGQALSFSSRVPTEQEKRRVARHSTQHSSH